MDIKNKVITDTKVAMTFCANCKNCPAIDIDADSDIITIGGEDEGYTQFTKEQFKLFMKEVKSGTFDKILDDGNI